MGSDSKLAQIIAITIMVGALFCFSWLTVWGQSQLIDQPIVSDELAAKADTLRVVGKDELQRLFNDEVLRTQRLENRVTELEREVRELRAQIEGG